MLRGMADVTDLTEKQQAVYDYIKRFIGERGMAPSYEEIRKAFRFRSYNSVQKYLKRLEEKGHIKSPWGNRKRALELTDPGPMQRTIPLLGTVAAGRPIEAIETHDTVEVPETLLRGDDHFALKVVGDSMVDDGIREGDIIIVKRQRDARNGQTVIALIGDDATVKQYHRKGDRIELRPANPRMKPIFVSEGDIQIQGVVIGLIRRFDS
jgi:repressor LexA